MSYGYNSVTAFSKAMTDISDEAIDTLVAHCAIVPSPFTQVGFQQLGNAAQRILPNATAFNHREARYELMMLSMRP